MKLKPKLIRFFEGDLKLLTKRAHKLGYTDATEYVRHIIHLELRKARAK